MWRQDRGMSAKTVSGDALHSFSPNNQGTALEIGALSLALPVIMKTETPPPSAEGSAFNSCPASLQNDLMKVWFDLSKRAFLRYNYCVLNFTHVKRTAG